MILGGEFLWNCTTKCSVTMLWSTKRCKDKTNYLIFHNFVNIFRIEWCFFLRFSLSTTRTWRIEEKKLVEG